MNILKIEIEHRGRTFRMCSRSDDPLIRYCDDAGSFWELNELERLENLVKRRITAGSVIMDVGANIGQHTLFFADAFPGNTVVAYEMNPEAFGFLSTNVTSNGLSNVKLVNRGLSDMQRRCGVLSPRDNPIGGAQLDLHCQERNVEIVTLDEDLGSLGIVGMSDIPLIKLDVEGHENHCLRGALKTIKKYRPFLFLECKEVMQYKWLTTLMDELSYVLVEASPGFFPNFLFVHREHMSTYFTDPELDWVRTDYGFRIVKSWQLVRKLRVVSAGQNDNLPT